MGTKDKTSLHKVPIFKPGLSFGYMICPSGSTQQWGHWRKLPTPTYLHADALAWCSSHAWAGSRLFFFGYCKECSCLSFSSSWHQREIKNLQYTKLWIRWKSSPKSMLSIKKLRNILFRRKGRVLGCLKWMNCICLPSGLGTRTLRLWLIFRKTACQS